MIVSKNAFIRATGVFHVCPVIREIPAGPVHLRVKGNYGESGTVLCGQIKIIDPDVRTCTKRDFLAYSDIMNLSDTIHGMFEYDQ